MLRTQAVSPLKMKQSGNKKSFFRPLVLGILLLCNLGLTRHGMAMDASDSYEIAHEEIQERTRAIKAQIGITSLIAAQVILSTATLYLTYTHWTPLKNANDAFSRAQCPVEDYTCLAELNPEGLKAHFLLPTNAIRNSQWMITGLDLGGIVFSLIAIPLIWTHHLTAASYVSLFFTIPGLIPPVLYSIDDLSGLNALAEKTQASIKTGEIGHTDQLVADLQTAKKELDFILQTQPQLIATATIAGTAALAATLWTASEALRSRYPGYLPIP